MGVGQPDLLVSDSSVDEYLHTTRCLADAVVGIVVPLDGIVLNQDAGGYALLATVMDVRVGDRDGRSFSAPLKVLVTRSHFIELTFR